MLLCLAYPNLSALDAKLIRDFRRQHDTKYVDVVEAHWTLIFPGSTRGLSHDELTCHIADVASRSASIEFICRYALVYNDDESDDYYLFLIPDEGFSSISLLHDRLYSELLRPRLRLDLPYIPHIGIATSQDRDSLYELAMAWNQSGREIRGSIDVLTFCAYRGGKVDDLVHFNLDPKASK